MTIGTHRGAHEFDLCEIDDIQVNKQVPSRLEVGFWIPTLCC
jgi:hypothetical protein